MERLRTFLRQGLRFLWWLPLAIPSLWFLKNIPPLWRDSDGFYQVRAEIGGLTLLLWPPLYCLTVRVPLAICAKWKGIPFSFDAPALTDSGVGLVIFCQHLLLVGAVAWFISTIAQRNGVRLAISTLFAFVPAFYAFANTVGSESLSNTTQFAVMAGAVLLLKNSHPRWLPWLGYSVLLVLAILTRHINAVFAALLPAAFLLRTAIALARNPERSSFAVLRVAFLPVAIAVIAGAAALFASNLTVRALCSASGTAYSSKLGFVFQWRTAFIETKSTPERTKFFDAVCRRLDDPLAIRALRTYEAAIQTGAHPQPGFLSDFIKGTLKKDSSRKRNTRLIMAAATLNRIAIAVLTSSPPGYWNAVREDFWKNFTIDPHAITLEPAANTEYFITELSKPDFEPLRTLVTFRNGYFQKAVVDFSSHFYLTTGKGISIGALTVIALLLWLFTLRISDAEGWQIVYPPALLGTGWLLIFLNCCTTFFMARFALPLLGTTLAAVFISLACLLERIGTSRKTNQAVRHTLD